MYYFIVNPASKTGKGKLLWDQIELYLKTNDIEYTVYASKKPGHVVEIVNDLTKNLTEPIKMIALGGDGTINEVLQGIKDYSNVQLGYIPTGSSNDLARDLKLPTNPIECLKQILRCEQPTPMDLGCVTYNMASDSENKLESKYFDVSCGIGYDAAVCEEVLTSPLKKSLNKIGLGKLTYLLVALKQLLAAKWQNAKMILDDETIIELPNFLFICCMIHKYEGGGFKFCPSADYQDGILDICAANNISKLKVLLALPQAAKGNHLKFKGIHSYKAKKIQITTDSPCWFHTDGEVSVKSNSFTVSCEMKRIQLLM